jgi:hypothetical protein
MKKHTISLFVILFLFIGSLNSCVSLTDQTMTSQERVQAQVIGSVTAEFTSFQPLHIINGNSIRRKAYTELRRAAQRQYQGNIDIKNIVIAGSGSGWQAVQLIGGAGMGLVVFTTFYDDLPEALIGVPPGIAVSLLIGNSQRITAIGDVVLYDSVSTGTINQENMRNVLATVSQTLIERLPNNSRIAVLNISSSNRNDSEYLIDEIEYRLVNSGIFSIVDRRQLDQIRNELNFQMSGDVDDNSAISIGNMLGANIVLTGNISGTGLSQWLNIRALDVRTAQIIAMIREQL